MFLHLEKIAKEDNNSTSKEETQPKKKDGLTAGKVLKGLGKGYVRGTMLYAPGTRSNTSKQLKREGDTPHQVDAIGKSFQGAFGLGNTGIAARDAMHAIKGKKGDEKLSKKRRALKGLLAAAHGVQGVRGIKKALKK